MKNKIDPRQYTPYALNTPSGNLSFIKNVDSFSCYLLENQTGNFNYTGSLKVNDIDIYLMDSSNNLGGIDTTIFAGLSNTITGTNNSIIASSSSQISGQGNLILGGQSSLVADADFSAALFGRNTIVNHTGAVIIADSDLLRDKFTQGTDSFTLDFTGGHFIQDDLFLKGEFRATGGDVFIDGFNLNITGGNLNVSAADSGVFSGDLQVLGTAYHTGSPFQDLRDLVEHSGRLQTNMDVQHSFTMNTTGNQLATGEKTFESKMFTRSIEMNDSGLLASKTGNTEFYLNNNDDFLGGNAIVGKTRNSVSFIINETGGPIIGPTGETTQFTRGSFSVLSNASNPIAADLCFGVNQSGDALFKRTIKMSDSRFVPSVGTDLGVSGQMTWDENYLYVCTGAGSGWGRVALVGW